MQLTGSRFTDATAVVGNDLATLPDFPAEIRAPAGTPHGVSAFQIHFASRDILTPGDQPNVARGHEPGRADHEPAGAREGRHADRQRGRLQRPQPAQGRLRREPARGRLARRLPGLPRADDLDDRARHRGHRRHHAARRGPLQEPLRARPGLLDVRSARRSPRRHWIEKKFADNAAVRDANLAAFRAGYNFGETAELFAVHYEVDAGPGAARHLPQRQRDAGARLRADRGERPLRPAAVPRSLPDHARLRAAARALAPPPLRRSHDPGRGRDRRRQHGARRRLRRPPRRHRHERPGHGPEGRDDRPRGGAGAAARDRRHPAGRPVDRACRPRPRPPTC